MLQAVQPPKNGETVIVVPCYNEASRLNLAAFDQFLRLHPDVVLLFVDDGSNDDTPQLLERIRQMQPEQTRLLRLAKNVGKAEAVRQGMQLALTRRPAMVGFWDADLATPLDAIPRFQTVLRSFPELLLVMGSRVALLGRRIQRKPWRHVLGRAFATAASLALRLPVYDTQCGAKLFRVTDRTTELFTKPFCSRWVFDVEILARVIATARIDGQLPAREVVYEYPLEHWQDVRSSRLKPWDFVVAGFDLANIYWRYTLGRPQLTTPHYQSKLNHPTNNIEQREAA
jgi:glycosyltransferase involved in cell wall biosynthesis